MSIIKKLKQVFVQQARSTQHLAEIAAGSDNQQRLLNDKLTQAIVALADLSDLLRSKLDAVVAGREHEERLLNDKLGMTVGQVSEMTDVLQSKIGGGGAAL